MRKTLFKNRNFIFLVSFFTLILIGAIFIIFQKSKPIEISNNTKGSSASSTPLEYLSNGSSSPISGLPCVDALRRPVAVMLSNDAEARPESGISEADIVFEMQVVENTITRTMAVFVCGNPKELGSVRSARDSFIPLARGLDAVLAHWGGEQTALEKLNAGIMDNLDAFKDEIVTFFRKAGIPQPHNGFTSTTRLINRAKKLGYRLENKFVGYPHLADKSAQNKAMTLSVGYSGIYAVRYDYDPASNSYLRWRADEKEIDKNSGKQVAAKNIVIMRAVSEAIDEQYNKVQVEGEGKITVYRNGEEIQGTWKKNAKDQISKLFFYDKSGAEIKFVPGQIWVEIVDPGQNIIWQ